MEEVRLVDAVQYLFWLDTRGTLRQPIVHALHSKTVRTSRLLECPTEGECHRQNAHEFVRTNTHVS